MNPNLQLQTYDDSISASKIVYSVSDVDSASMNFNWVYNYVKPKTVIKEITDPVYDLRITKLSQDNKAYISNTVQNGLSEAIVVKVDGSGKHITLTDFQRNSYYVTQQCKKARDLVSSNKSVLPNCVGWVNGRMHEIQNIAKSSTFISSDGTADNITKYKITKTDAPITGSFDDASGKIISARFPAGMAGSQAASQPNATGFSVHTEASYHPLPGDVICQTKNGSTSGEGHVAFVEAVYNRNGKDEYIITSESSYSYSGLQNLVYTKKYTRGSNTQKYSNSYTFAGFLSSPLNQLTAIGTTLPTISITKIEPSQAEIQLLNAWKSDLSDYAQVKEFKLGDEVIIQQFGNTKANGKGSKVNLGWTKGTIVVLERNKEYPYGVSINGKLKVSAWYQASALELQSNL